MPSFLSSLFSILILVLILLAAYFTARLAGTRIGGMYKSRYMEVIDRIIIARDKAVLLVKAGEHIYIIGMTPQGMNKIAELPSSELPLLSEDQPGPAGFGSILKETLKNAGIPGFSKRTDLYSDREQNRYGGGYSRQNGYGDNDSEQNRF